MRGRRRKVVSRTTCLGGLVGALVVMAGQATAIVTAPTGDSDQLHTSDITAGTQPQAGVLPELIDVAGGGPVVSRPLRRTTLRRTTLRRTTHRRTTQRRTTHRRTTHRRHPRRERRRWRRRLGGGGGAGASARDGALPFTGSNEWMVGLIGLVCLLAGTAIHRMARPLAPSMAAAGDAFTKALVLTPPPVAPRAPEANLSTRGEEAPVPGRPPRDQTVSLATFARLLVVGIGQRTGLRDVTFVREMSDAVSRHHHARLRTVTHVRPEAGPEQWRAIGDSRYPTGP